MLFSETTLIWYIASAIPSLVIYEYYFTDSLLHRQPHSISTYANSTILATVGDHLTLTCNSTYEIKWIKIGLFNHINEQDIMYTENENVYSAKLKLDFISFADAGIYACTLNSFLNQPKNEMIERIMAFSTNVQLKVRRANVSGSTYGRLIRHSPNNLLVKEHDSISFCVDWLSPYDSAFEFMQEFEKEYKSGRYWHVPASVLSTTASSPSKETGVKYLFFKRKRPSFDYENGNIKATDDDDEEDDNGYVYSLCLQINYTTLVHSGIYQLRLPNATNDDYTLYGENDSENSMDTTVEFNLKVTANLADSVTQYNSQESEASLDHPSVRLLAGKVYEFACWARNNASASENDRYQPRLIFNRLASTKTLTSPWCRRPVSNHSIISAFDLKKLRRDVPPNVRVDGALVLAAVRRAPGIDIAAGMVQCSSVTRQPFALNTFKFYAVVDDVRFIDDRSDVLIETKIANSVQYSTSGSRVISMPKSSRVTLTCLVPRCLFARLKWTHLESGKIIADTNLTQIPYRRNSNSSQFGHLYSLSTLTLAYVIKFSSLKASQTGTYVCEGSEGATIKKGSVKLIVQERLADSNPDGRSAVVIRPEAMITYQQVSAIRRSALPLCSDVIKPTIVGATVGALLALAVVGTCTIVICYRLSRVNLLERSSMVIKNKPQERTRSQRKRLISNNHHNTVSLAAEEASA